MNENKLRRQAPAQQSTLGNKMRSQIFQQKNEGNKKIININQNSKIQRWTKKKRSGDFMGNFKCSLNRGINFSYWEFYKFVGFE